MVVGMRRAAPVPETDEESPMTETANQLTTTQAEAYVRFWNLTEEHQRELGRELFAPDVVQYAPVGELSGLDSLIGFTRRFADAMGDYAFRRRSMPEQHHGRIRIQWELLHEDASFAEGTDVLTLDSEGRVASVTTFLDRAPAGFDPHAHA
jgi:hypothetical protein